MRAKLSAAMYKVFVKKKADMGMAQYDLADDCGNARFGLAETERTVMESVGTVDIVVVNKTGLKGEVRICTIDGTAHAHSDY